MGCSSSRSFTAKNSEDHSPFASSSHSHCSSSSASRFSNSSPLVPKRALSLPMPLVHHPPTKKGDSHHLVSLTSTTYGSLLLIDSPTQKVSNFNSHGSNGDPQSPPHDTKLSQQTEPITEKSFSPDSIINTWELMDGLDDDHDDTSKPQRSTFDNPIMDNASKKPSSCRYTTFDGSIKKRLDFSETNTMGESFTSSPISPLSKKPLWKHLSEEALLAELDPNVSLSYQKALSSRGFSTLRSIGSSSPLSCCSSPSLSSNNNLCSLPSIEDRLVVYFTSLRGIRKTYEDCCSVRMILKGFRVAIDEKDISMDLSYRKELQNLLGEKVVTLPQVFVRGKHLGNAEEIKMMNESGELANLLKGFPIKDPFFVCESCGDLRFIPCTNCNGSRKAFEKGEGELRRCSDCNENGLIKCPSCCS